jgi:hypothetical protein
VATRAGENVTSALPCYVEGTIERDLGGVRGSLT